MMTLEGTCIILREIPTLSLSPFLLFPSAYVHLTSPMCSHINHTYSLDPTQSTTNLNPPVPSHARITPEDIIWIDGLLYC
jgi:hypothetical protein